jgi:hypothetical protein
MKLGTTVGTATWALFVACASTGTNYAVRIPFRPELTCTGEPWEFELARGDQREAVLQCAESDAASNDDPRFWWSLLSSAGFTASRAQVDCTVYSQVGEAFDLRFENREADVYAELITLPFLIDESTKRPRPYREYMIRIQKSRKHGTPDPWRSHWTWPYCDKLKLDIITEW